MIEQLFGSKTRVKLLQLFYSNPNRSFYVREITRKIDEQINSVRRELANLLNVGIIVSDNTNNRLYYEVNQAYEFYEPLRVIFGGGTMAVSAAGAEKKTGASVAPRTRKTALTPEEEKLKALGNLEIVIFTGQFTRDESSGIDILVVGDVNQNAIAKYISELEAQENKEIRYTVMPVAEFSYRRQIKDRFITTVIDAKKQIIVDKSGTL
ncbi:MAG TPA: transcriptional regulator [Candidatus Saccharimonadales bacterium]|nr:transcriptional regulator [Candidatus Saccharimonadales bacterium]